jgi:acetylornithine deacetylase/succinyl-diaminopimelate desuccinylase family protein
MSTAGLRKTLADLVSINSVNPAYAHGQTEEQIQRYVRAFFEERGFETFAQHVMPGRENMIARLPGRDDSIPLVFEAHCDTAGIEGMDAPFCPTIRDSRMYGRGTCDTKAGLAAMMWALADLKRSGKSPKCEVWAVSAVDEEHAYQGVVKLSMGLKAQGAVVSEPTQMRMAVASKGCIRARITLRGKAAHSSKPEVGINAITHMARWLGELEEEQARLTLRRHRLVGSPTFNVGMIEGGTQVNIVAAACTITIDRRLIPGEDPDEVMADYRRMLAMFQDRYPGLQAEMEAPMMKDWPLETSLHSSIVRCTSEVLCGFGLSPEPVGVPFGSDASKLANVAIPSIILGPGNIDQAHTSQEYVELLQLEQAFEVYRQIMVEFE